jgi:hypothetical protein
MSGNLPRSATCLPPLNERGEVALLDPIEVDPIGSAIPPAHVFPVPVRRTVLLDWMIFYEKPIIFRLRFPDDLQLSFITRHFKHEPLHTSYGS